jgi:hypothetical protein
MGRKPKKVKKVRLMKNYKYDKRQKKSGGILM